MILLISWGLNSCFSKESRNELEKYRKYIGWKRIEIKDIFYDCNYYLKIILGIIEILKFVIVIFIFLF